MKELKTGFLNVRLWPHALAFGVSLACLASTLSIGTAWANPLFAGISGIQAETAPDEGTRIRFEADLPFEYQMQILDANRVLVRVYNAKLSDRLLTPEGELQGVAGAASINGRLKMPDRKQLFAGDYQEVIFSGPGLGSRPVHIAGATELPVAHSIAFRPPAADSQKTAVAARSSGAKSSPLLKAAAAPRQVAAKPAHRTPARKAEKPGKPVVQFPEIAALQADMTHRDDESEAMAMLGQMSDPVQPAERIDIEAGSSRAPATQKPAAPQKPSPAAGPSIETVREAPVRGPQVQSVAGPQSPIEPNPLMRPGRAVPTRPAPQAVEAEPASPVAASADMMPVEEDAAASPKAEAGEIPEPNYRMVMAIPRYRGGAAPIRAVTLNAQGQPIVIRPKNTAIAEFNIDQGGYNALFHAESSEVGQRMAEALRHYRSRGFDAALAEMEAALRIDPANAELYAALGEIQLKRSQPEAAVFAYRKARELVGGKYDERYAQMLALAGERTEAVGILKALYRENPRRAQLAYMLGTLHEELGDTRQALDYLKQATRLHPASADIQYNLGLAYELSGDREAAEKHYRQVITLNPDAQEAVQALERVRN